MKASKKIQKRLDAQINDYSKVRKDTAGAFHCPGSRKKVH